MKVVFDTSVWIEHLRRDALAPLLPSVRGKHPLWMDAFVAAELAAGCRSRIERRVIDDLVAPFARTNRLAWASATHITDAGRALSILRERGIHLKNAAGALIDATIGITAARMGALLVTENTGDFASLAKVVPLRWETLEVFSARFAA